MRIFRCTPPDILGCDPQEFQPLAQSGSNVDRRLSVICCSEGVRPRVSGLFSTFERDGVVPTTNGRTQCHPHLFRLRTSIDHRVDSHSDHIRDHSLPAAVHRRHDTCHRVDQSNWYAICRKGRNTEPGGGCDQTVDIEDLSIRLRIDQAHRCAVTLPHEDELISRQSGCGRQ